MSTQRKNWRQKHLAGAHDGTADARPVMISAMEICAEEFCRLAASIEDVRMISARGQLSSLLPPQHLCLVIKVPLGRIPH